MNFEYNEDQLAIKEMAKNFSETEFKPYASEWDQEEIFPVEALKKAAELGLAAIYVNEKHGGSGLSRLDAAIVFEELSRGCVSTAAYLTIHNMVTWMIDSHGSETLKEKFIKKLSTMDIMSSYCLTEAGSGSDAAALKTTALKKGNSHYLLNGSKSFISGGPTSDVFAVMCRTGGEGANGVSCLLVEKGTKGLSFGKQEKKMGWNSQHTSMVNFDNCEIPIENIVGNEGDGFKIAMKGLDGGRVNIANQSVSGRGGTIIIDWPFAHGAGSDHSHWSSITATTHGINFDTGAIHLFFETQAGNSYGTLYQQFDNTAWTYLNANVLKGDGSEWIYIQGSYLTN